MRLLYRDEQRRRDGPPLVLLHGYRHELVNATPSQSDGLVGAEGLLWTPSDDAVAEGFEPSKALALHAFEACSLGRSDTPPPGRLPKPVGWARIGCCVAVHLSDYLIAIGVT